MNKEEFTAFHDKKPKPNKWLIVTNNIDAKNAYGEMSHVWLTNFWTVSADPLLKDDIVMFTDNDRRIIGLSHWKYA